MKMLIAVVLLLSLFVAAPFAEAVTCKKVCLQPSLTSSKCDKIAVICTAPAPSITPNITPVPCSNCGAKPPEVPKPVIYSSPNICWLKANYPALYSGKTFDLACPNFGYKPQCTCNWGHWLKTGLTYCPFVNVTCGK